jgi:hypothetical protein
MGSYLAFLKNGQTICYVRDSLIMRCVMKGLTQEKITNNPNLIAITIEFNSGNHGLLKVTGNVYF